jgi:uncharacterized membrane protein YsdA (DUF1294 family)
MDADQQSPAQPIESTQPAQPEQQMQPEPAQPVQPEQRASYRETFVEQQPAYRTSAILGAILWLIVFGVFIYETDWNYITNWVFAGTIVTFLFFVGDKLFATARGSRVPSGVLWGMSLLGGVIGAWLGMIILRHKFDYKSFWTVQVVATIIWGALLIWYFFIR